jgi:L-asparagine transporter-like permease
LEPSEENPLRAIRRTRVVIILLYIGFTFLLQEIYPYLVEFLTRKVPFIQGDFSYLN